jgi:hypothetical protein
MKRIIFGLFGGFIGCLALIYTLFNKVMENDGFRLSFVEGWRAFVRAAVFGEESIARPTSWWRRRPYTYRDYMRDRTKRRYGYSSSMMQDQDDNDIEEVEHVFE